MNVMVAVGKPTKRNSKSENRTRSFTTVLKYQDEPFSSTYFLEDFVHAIGRRSRRKYLTLSAANGRGAS